MRIYIYYLPISVDSGLLLENKLKIKTKLAAMNAKSGHTVERNLDGPQQLTSLIFSEKVDN